MNYAENETIVYQRLLNAFCDKTESQYWRMWKYKVNNDLSGLMIPHTLPDYGKSVKIFYYGQDTLNNWTSLESVYKKDENDQLNYLSENNKWPENVDQIYKETDKNPYHYWRFVLNLQSKIQNINYMDNREYEYEKMNSFGLGNVFPLELVSTIKKDIWRTRSMKAYIDLSIYNEIFENAKEFSKLKYLLPVYQPEYIVILVWRDDIEDWLSEEINYEFMEKESINKKISVYNIEKYGTKVFWIYHPQALIRKKIKYQEVIKAICNRL